MNSLENFKQIRAFIFDIDGVLTDGSLIVQSDGQLIRTMNIKDGYALVLAVQKGYKIAVISGGNSQESKIRLELLGIKDIYLKVENKKLLLDEWAAVNSIALEDILYMGDDMPDLECIKSVGLGVCPADAVAEIKIAATYVSNINGGKGCVRDVIEKVLKLNNQWE